MQYISTRGGIAPVGFRDAVMMGLARDGGLLLPESIPDVTDRLEHWASLSYAELAFEVMGCFAGELGDGVLRDLVSRSYSTFRHPEVTPVKRVGDVHVLELWHGPTLAFKDVALQFLGNLFEQILEERDERINIVAATSGDTGSAAIYGVRGRERIRIFVMHPHGRVSPVQERQMTSVLDENVHNLAVEGTFDDCQNIVKALFGDLAFRDGYRLGAVNSINWARVLAQIVYYFYAAFRVMARSNRTKVRFSVPTGNFGDIFAGYVARKMGLPIDKLVLATNENDILTRFFCDGDYTLGDVHPTLSPSMDIQVASNFERYLYYRSGGDTDQVARWMADVRSGQGFRVEPGANGAIDDLFVAGSCDRAATLETIREYQDDFGYLLDPHTAVGVHVGRAFLCDDAPMICLSTAHPAKFAGAIREATGEDLAHHDILDALMELPTRSEMVAAEVSAVADVVRGCVDE